MTQPLSIPCTVCGKLDSHCFSQVPVPRDHLQWVRENTIYDSRLLSECDTHEARMSMGHLYISHNRAWDKATYDQDGISDDSLPPDRYVRWLQRFRRSKAPPPTVNPSFCL